MARVCHCTGYINNPGGVCCMDLPSGGPRPVTVNNTYVAPLTEERIRQIIREELDR